GWGTRARAGPGGRRVRRPSRTAAPQARAARSRSGAQSPRGPPDRPTVRIWGPGPRGATSGPARPGVLLRHLVTAVTAVTTFSPGPPMRPFFPLVALASFTAAPAFAQQPARPDTTRPQQRTGQGEGPKPYAEVITRAATTDSGVFI